MISAHHSPSNPHRILPPPPLTTPTKSRKVSGSFSTASSCCSAASSSDASTSQTQFATKYSKQLLVESPLFEASTPLLGMPSNPFDENKNSRFSALTSAQVVPRNLKSMSSIDDDLDSIDSSCGSPWPMQTRSTSSSPRKISSVHGRHQPQPEHLLQLFKCDALETLDSPKIQLRLPALSKPPNNDVHQTKRNEKNEIHPICNLQPAGLTHKDAYKQRIFAFKKVFKVSKQPMHQGAAMTVTPRVQESSPLNNLIKNINSPHQVQSLITSPRKMTAATAAFSPLVPFEENSPQLKSNREREMIFIRLKFMQIDILNSMMVSKQEVIDFFEGRWGRGTISQSELSGFNYEEKTMREHSGLFLRSVSDAVTERSGLLNQREFSKLMRDFFDTFREDAAATEPVEDMLQSTHSVDLQSPRKQEGIHRQINVKRRQLKSAQIVREKAVIAEEAAAAAQSNRNTLNKEINSTNNYIEMQMANPCVRDTGKSQSPPRLRAVIPRLRSLSIKVDDIRKVTNYLPNSQIRSHHPVAVMSAGVKMRSNTNDHFTYECHSEPMIELKDVDNKQKEDISVPPFDCTFQPHHFKWLNVQQQQQQQQQSTNQREKQIDETAFLQTFNINNKSKSIENQSAHDCFTQKSEFKLRNSIEKCVPEILVDQISLKSGSSPQSKGSASSPMKKGVDLIDQNCSNFLLRREVKVLKKPFSKKKSDVIDSKSSDLESQDEESLHKGLVKRLDKLSVNDIDGKNKPIHAVIGYDINLGYPE